ncbi:hypothetical protein GUITHDRAFT_108114 [Guillardia theta CCMP2712]|uniref:F-box domain-containing protein n=2 Tax=Guillardia theta TaxID=55529 RepID=L1JC02_GUITC|nr:hypothetical protein GUITHDRAFT_108114 [Guillardia theta CCMP2712]EKX46078.1 hypothetical protein GUITHDRAFT_108114 [Guillardia theta CCMP2712]|eukprot:XP_005833058.1 hypothetical protein GUITHDRAFT_108114 [Guillardia theta CCMP2712]
MGGEETLLRRAALAVAENEERYESFGCMPEDVADRIMYAIQQRGQVSLGTLLKFSSCTLTSVGLGSHGVTDDWMFVLSCMHLKTLDLSSNPWLTDAGIALLVSFPRSTSGGRRSKQDGGRASPMPRRRKSSSKKKMVRQEGRNSEDSESAGSTPSSSSWNDSWSMEGCMSRWNFAGGSPSLSVQSLILTGTGVSNSGLAFLPQLPHLTRLEIGQTDRISNTGMQWVARCAGLSELRCTFLPKVTTGVQFLSELKGLTYLDLQGCSKLTDACVQPLASLGSLERLDLRFCPKISNVMLRTFALLKSLSDLQLSSSGIRIADTSNMPYWELSVLKLVSISLSECLIEPSMLSTLSCLESLYLLRCSFCSCDRCNLRHAHDARCVQGDLHGSLLSLKRLRSLQLVRCSLPDDCIDASLLNGLTMLNLCESQYASASLRQIFHQGTSLASLNLMGWDVGHEEVGDKGQEAESRSLSLSLLERLELPRFVGISAHLRDFSGFSMLRTLDLKHSDMRDEAAASLMSLLFLEWIDVSKCKALSLHGLLASLPPNVRHLFARGLKVHLDHGERASRSLPSGQRNKRAEEQESIFEMSDEEGDDNDDDNDRRVDEQEGEFGSCQEEGDYLNSFHRLDQLETLDISSSDILISKFLGEFPPTLRVLKLNQCVNVCRQLHTILPEQLQQIELNGCYSFGDVGLQSMVRKCKRLRDISLVGVPFGDAGACSIASLNSLQTLRIQTDSRTPLTDHGRAILYSKPNVTVISVTSGTSIY